MVNDDLVLTACYKKIIFTVYYKSEEMINIIGVVKEEVKENQSPRGTRVEAEDKNATIIWKANKDVILKNGKVIRQGETLTKEEIKQLIVKDDLILTAYGMNNVIIDVPDTGSRQTIITIITGLALISLGGYVIYKRKENVD